MSSIPCTPKGNSKHHAADPHSCTSSLSSGSVTGDWSIGSPVLSITSIDPCSPSLRFQDRPQGSRSGSAPFPISEVGGDDEEADRAADLRHKASNYLQYIESLSQAYESQLNALSAFFKINEDSLAGSVQDQFESYMDDPAVTIIEICRDGTRHLIGIDDVDMLVDYFCEQEEEEESSEGPGGLMLQKNSGVSVISRVFLLDKITPDIMGVFGAKLGVEPQFWDAHLQLGTTKSMAESSNAAGSSGQLVRYGSESGSKVSFLNIPLLRRYPSSESLDKKEGGRNLPPNQRESEGCSIHLDYNTNDAEPATVLIMVNHGSETTNTSSKALRTSFVEHLMSTSFISVPTPLTHNLIKAILHHLTSTLTSIPQQTQQHTSQFTINLFKDDTDKIRESISSEATVISTLSKTLSNSLLAVDNSSASSSTTAGASGSGVKALDTLAPLLQQFQEQTEQVTQWLQDLDTAVVDSQRQREARLRRLKIVVPVCSISLAIGVVIVFVTRLGVPDGV
ncbi:hypothetical protein TWF225_002919 [Orbilia oligospora]|uniref:Uncharacterized protein n=1 Tax=Orbilia oligospora TaxID=2813651 RepID=A0A7C8PGG1_ORBOL|nr:hypothetical protein TWF751_002496 [Orbilia oligospora]KAF3161260.1 hypothetical protein TWF225_002919 [Orbilia oligospora]KAF3240321.1 hypothetical protein TWF128_011343 [Orbilia oligospora]KAF3247425.1 hypothetical protein TWF217_009584 [Orbilia oligospora]TGJ68667.1 hypothetical protein EYR41_004760 [Orbilia oligospora]